MNSLNSSNLHVALYGLELRRVRSVTCWCTTGSFKILSIRPLWFINARRPRASVPVERYKTTQNEFPSSDCYHSVSMLMLRRPYQVETSYFCRLSSWFMKWNDRPAASLFLAPCCCHRATCSRDYKRASQRAPAPLHWAASQFMSVRIQAACLTPLLMDLVVNKLKVKCISLVHIESKKKICGGSGGHLHHF